MTLLRKYLLRNWGLKLLALVVAFFLWVSYTSEPLAEAGYMAPIVFRNLPPGMDLSGEEVTQAHVVLRGRPTLLRRLQPADLAITINLAGETRRELAVPLTADKLDIPLGAEIARITPPEIRLKLLPRQPSR